MPLSTVALPTTSTQSPLSGIRVIDLSHVIAGPLASFFLAQMGAEVIKIEAPGRGDIYRRPVGDAADTSISSGFASLNAGKRSCAIDIKTPEGTRLVQDLVTTADVFLENFRPGAMARYGLDYPTLRVQNPDLIYCSVSAYGQTGSWSARGAYDHVIQAASGMMMTNGSGEDDTPVKVGFPLVDVATGWSAALAVVSAVLKRERFGGGEHIDASMMQASMALMAPLVTSLLSDGKKPVRQGNRGHSGSPAADVYRCHDGWIALGANTPRQLRSLLVVLQLQELLYDPTMFDPELLTDDSVRFVRARNPEQVRQCIQQRVGTRGANELERHLNEQGVPAAKVRRVDEILLEVERNALMTMPFTQYGARPKAYARTTGLGFHWTQTTRNQARAKIPDLGDDTQTVLRELGKPTEEIERLQRQKVIA